MTQKKNKIQYIVDQAENLFRLDQFLTLAHNTSRSKIEYYIQHKKVKVNDIVVTKKSTKLMTGDAVEISQIEQEIKKKNALPIPILFENNDFLVINKPAAIYTHDRYENDPEYSVADFAKQYWQGSDNPELRFGIVHRLDKDTSGVMIIARNEKTLGILKLLFQQRLIKKKYIAFTQAADILDHGQISVNIMRDPLYPIQMTWSLSQGKSAATYYQVLSRYNNYMKIACYPYTGRTHQIRVHLHYLGSPILGDTLYGLSSELIDRQALHAESIQFVLDNKEYFFISSLPDDMILLDK